MRQMIQGRFSILVSLWVTGVPSHWEPWSQCRTWGSELSHQKVEVVVGGGAAYQFLIFSVIGVDGCSWGLLILQSFQPAMRKGREMWWQENPLGKEMQMVTFGCQVNVHHRVRANGDMDRCYCGSFFFF